MLLDSEQIRSIPVLGSMIEERSRKTVPRARRYAARLPILSSAITYSHLTQHWPKHSYESDCPSMWHSAPHRHESLDIGNSCHGRSCPGALLCADCVE